MYQKPDEKIREKANRESLDSLTGVLKKNVAEEQIASNMREKQGGALFLCGVNYIKRVNEQYGYLAGDECLKQTARILSYMIRPNDILGRWSGDEFVIFEASVESVGGSAVRESGMKIGAGEHNHSEKVIHVAKAKSGTDDEFD
ncbi:MAG: GGDEF domain-containing protein, partial [Oscillospiraceae bacterium]|nr:GGDEF domain-containing protein [Oscillospiraceae bacterium]